MGFATDVIEEIAKFSAWVIFDVLMVGSGEIVLWIATGGRRAPRWDQYTSERPRRMVVFSELSCWVGIASWLIVFLAVHRLISGASSAV
jgi:hypothetical protein